MIYRADQLHEFDPGPCPTCGERRFKVNWISVDTAGDIPGTCFVPGTVECWNPDCDHYAGPRRTAQT